MDRHRQMMRIVADSESDSYESLRPKRRAKSHSTGVEADEGIPSKRDAGYSQAVRRACSQRLVQLIPVRRTSLAALIGMSWGLWAFLLVAHYLVHVRDSGSLRLLPIAYLFDMRHYFGISHWLGTQLWMLTAVAAFLIYQLRKHKLDDYRAKYRVWLGLIGAALFASMDSSTSILRLIGESIDTWARAEIGYSGWAVVLATFASLIGVLGLRLCNELMSAPTAVGFWLGGLICWGISALLGTGLLHSPWSKEVLDLVVGGSWLGGILSVWLASAIYLRHIYLQAQRRFLQRGVLLKPIRIQMPQLAWSRKGAEEEIEDADNESTESGRRKLRVPIISNLLRREKSVIQAGSREEHPSRKREAETKTRTQENASHRRTESTTPSSIEKVSSQPSSPASVDEKKRKWFGFGTASKGPAVDDPQRANRSSSDESADSVGLGRKQDVEPLAKVKRDGPSRWWPLGKSGVRTPKGVEDSHEQRQATSQKPSTTTTGNQRSSEASAHQADNLNPKSEKRTWFSKKPSAKANANEDRSEKSASSQTKKSWWGRSQTKDAKLETAKKPDSDQTAVGKENGKEKGKSWFGGLSKRVGKSDSPKTKSNAPKDSATTQSLKKKRGLFSFFDGIVLKPPAEGEEKGGQPKGASTKPNIQENRSLPSTMPDDGSDPEDRSDLYDRQMSKAERKKLRKDQGQRRSA